jgi:hypothetical protein
MRLEQGLGSYMNNKGRARIRSAEKIKREKIRSSWGTPQEHAVYKKLWK